MAETSAGILSIETVPSFQNETVTRIQEVKTRLLKEAGYENPPTFEQQFDEWIDLVSGRAEGLKKKSSLNSLYQQRELARLKKEAEVEVAQLEPGSARRKAVETLSQGHNFDQIDSQLREGIKKAQPSGNSDNLIIDYQHSIFHHQTAGTMEEYTKDFAWQGLLYLNIFEEIAQNYDTVYAPLITKKMGLTKTMSFEEFLTKHDDPWRFFRHSLAPFIDVYKEGLLKQLEQIPAGSAEYQKLSQRFLFASDFRDRINQPSQLEAMRDSLFYIRLGSRLPKLAQDQYHEDLADDDKVGKIENDFLEAFRPRKKKIELEDLTAPVEEEGEEENFDDLPPAAPTEIIPLAEEAEEEPLRREFNWGIGGDTTQIEKEAEGDRGVDYQMQLSQKKREDETKLGYGLRTLASGFWQKSIFSGLFRERERRWRRNLLTQVADLSHLPEDLVEEAMQQGRERTKKRHWLRRNTVDRVYNLGAQIFGLFDTTHRIEAQKWLKEQVIATRAGGTTANEKILMALAGGSAEREAFGARAASKSDEFFRHKKDDRREIITDETLQKQLRQDFFDLLTPYINRQMTDDQARRIIDDYCSFHGLTRGDQVISLRDRLGPRYQALQSQFTTVGSDMRQIAEYLRDNQERFVRDGIVTDPTKVDQWLAACQSSDPDKNLKIEIMVAEAEMSEGGDLSLKKREKTAQLLGERPKTYLEKNLPRWIGRFFPEAAFNEVTLATLAGYTTNLLISRGALKGAGMVTGISLIPLIATGVGAPVLIPIGAAALTAGTVAAVREVMRLRHERLTVETQASFSILPGQEGKLPWLTRVMGGIYGRTSREKLLEYAVDQKKASELMTGLVNQSGLFAQENKLTSALPENVSTDQLKTALRWLAESKARIETTAVTRRRFIQYDAQLSESQQQTILDGACGEVYERLNYLFSQKPELKQALGIAANKNFSDFYRELVDAYNFNLVGDTKGITADLKAAVGLLGEERTIGLINEQQGMEKRNRAFRWLLLRKGTHRFLGAAGTGAAIGLAVVEVKSLATGTPPPWPLHETGQTVPQPAQIENGTAVSPSEINKLGNIDYPHGFTHTGPLIFTDDHGQTHNLANLDIIDDNHDGRIDPGEMLIVRDPSTHEVLFHLNRDPTHDTGGGLIELFKPQKNEPQGVDLNGDGKPDITTLIPKNTHWVDNHNGTFDLQGTDNHGNTITFIDHAAIKSDGSISGGTLHQGVTYDNGQLIPGAGSSKETTETISTGQLLTHVDRQIHIAAENKHLQDFWFTNNQGHHGVRLEFRSGEITSPRDPNFTDQGDSLMQLAKEGKLVFSFWKEAPKPGTSEQILDQVQVRVNPDMLHNSHELNGISFGHDVKSDFVQLKLDPDDSTTTIEVIGHGEMKVNEFFKTFVNGQKFEAQIGAHPERVEMGNRGGILFSNETVAGREIYNAPRISMSVLTDETQGKVVRHLSTIAGGNLQNEVTVTKIETIPGAGHYEPRVEASIISETTPTKLGYDLVPVERETISEPGQYAAGFVPAPYTIYAETGKSPDRYVPSAIKPLPSYPFNFQQAGVKVKVRPPLVPISDQEKLSQDQINQIKKFIEDEEKNLSGDIPPEALKQLAQVYGISDEEMKQRLQDEEKRKRIATEVATQRLVEDELTTGLVFDKTLWEKTFHALGKPDSLTLPLINTLMTKAAAKPENSNKPLGQLLTDVLKQLINEKKLTEENAVKLADNIFNHYSSFYFQSPEGSQKLKVQLEKVRQQVLYEAPATINLPPTNGEPEIPAEQLLKPALVNFNPEKLEMETFSGPYRLSAGSDIGQERDKNEDSHLTLRLDNLGETVIAVADGMGGHEGGETASKKAIDVFKTRYQYWRINEKKNRHEALQIAIEEANNNLFGMNQAANSQMGTTLVAAVLDDDGSYVVANVGDSRAYKISKDQAKRLTKDHSLVEALISSGQSSESDRYTHPQKNQIYRNIGNKTTINIDFFQGSLQDNEQLLLCCDGLWEMTKDGVEDAQVIRRFARSSQDQQEVVRRLIAKANQEGGEDNITVVVAKKVS